MSIIKKIYRFLLPILLIPAAISILAYLPNTITSQAFAAYGTDSMAAYSIANTMMSFVGIGVKTLGIGVLALTVILLEARREKGAAILFNVGYFCLVGHAVLTAALVLLVPNGLGGLFTYNSRILSDSAIMLRVYALGYLLILIPGVLVGSLVRRHSPVATFIVCGALALTALMMELIVGLTAREGYSFFRVLYLAQGVRAAACTALPFFLISFRSLRAAFDPQRMLAPDPAHPIRRTRSLNFFRYLMPVLVLAPSFIPTLLSMICGRSIGAYALAAYSCANSVLNMIPNALPALAVIGLSVAAIRLEKGDTAGGIRTHRIFSIIFDACVLLMFALPLLLSVPLLRLMDTPYDIMDPAASFLRGYGLTALVASAVAVGLGWMLRRYSMFVTAGVSVAVRLLAVLLAWILTLGICGFPAVGITGIGPAAALVFVACSVLPFALMPVRALARDIEPTV